MSDLTTLSLDVGEGDLVFTPTPENPYAWDDIFNHTEVERLQYSTWRFYKFYIYLTIFLISSTIMITLVVLILKLTNSLLREYRSMLLMSCLAEGLFLLDNFLTQYSFRIKDQCLLVASDGPIRHLSFKVKSFFMLGYTTSLAMSINLIPANFYYRYVCVTQLDGTITTTKMILTYSVAFASGLVTGFSAWFAYLYSEEARPGFNYASLWYPQRPVPVIIVTDFYHFTTWIFLLYTFFNDSMAYVIALIFAYKTYKFIKINKEKYSKNAMEAQRQIAMTLFMQTIIPVFISVGPCVYITGKGASHGSIDNLSHLLLALITLIPMLSPLSTIVAIRPFREAVFGIFRRRKVRDSAPNSLS